MARRYVPVAEVARPHGIRGELRLKIYNEQSDLLLRRPAVKLVFPDGAEREVRINSARGADKAILVKLDGVDDCNAAEALRGAVVSVPRDIFPPLDEGEFYACDIEGARAVLPSGDEVGRVTGIASYPSCEVLMIARTGGGTFEVPLVATYVGNVDTERGVVELVTIEGLE